MGTVFPTIGKSEPENNSQPHLTKLLFLLSVSRKTATFQGATEKKLRNSKLSGSSPVRGVWQPSSEKSNEVGKFHQAIEKMTGEFDDLRGFTGRFSER